MLVAFLYAESVQISVGAIEWLGARSELKVEFLLGLEDKSFRSFMVC